MSEPVATAQVDVALRDAQRTMLALRGALNDLPAVLQEFAAVAAKTKLLGFNASILAAQAGREGRSFAVVAEQMKALNQRADASTQKLHALVAVLQRMAAQAGQSVDAACVQAGATKGVSP